MNPHVKLPRMSDQKPNTSRESSPASKGLLQPANNQNPSREPSPTNNNLLQLQQPHSEYGQGLYGLELPILKSIQSGETLSPVDLKRYAVNIIRDGKVTYTDKPDGSVSVALSSLVLTCCTNHSASKGDPRKITVP